MDYSTPGSSVLHALLEFAQIHAHGVSDANVVNADVVCTLTDWRETSLHPWNNAHLIMVYGHFSVLWNILLRTSAYKFIKNTGL